MTPIDLEQVARSYREACGVDCVVLDRGGQPDGCSFCQALRRDGKDIPSCADVHRYGAYQAERFGGQYIYFCANSLLHWAIPLTLGGETQAVLVGGPVLLVEAEEILGEYSQPALYAAELKAVPYMEPRRATALADVLFRLVRDLRQSQEPLDEPAPPFHPDQWYPDAETSAVNLYPFDKEKELLEVLAGGSRERAQALVNDILGQVFFTSGRKIATVRTRAHELLVLLSRAAVEGGASAEEVFGINQNWVQRIQQAATTDEIEGLLARVVRRFADCVFVLKQVKHADIMHKAVRFIRQNYQEKLSLESVAAQVYLSPTYFSRLFKDEMKTSFVTYLTEVRVEKSKRLLADRSISLVVVAGLVGFDDQSYFTRVFKRVTGMSPGKYRESRGG